MNLKDVIKIVILGFRRMRSDKDYRALQSYVAVLTLAELKKRGIDLINCDTLELGAGRGGYSTVLKERSKTFIASDFVKENFFEESGIPFKVVNVLEPFPFADNSFDFIYCSSVIEHLSSPSFMLNQVYRVLKSGGKFLLSFPPFYSLALVGGHQFKPFHFLGERMAIKATNALKKSKIQSYATAYGSFGLYPLKIGQVKKMLLDSKFDINHVYTRMCPLNTACLPGIFKDLVTWHVCYIAQKK